MKLTVSVYDGSRLVETLSDRPVRLTPDGKAGVVYAGEVYPVYSDNSISLSVRPTKKSLCYSFLEPGTPVPYARNRGATSRSPSSVSRWHLESNRFGHYIVFDGPKDAAVDLVSRLRNAQMTIIRWDASVRPADDGELYDWFIRLDYDGTAEQCRQAVSPVIRGDQPATAAETSTVHSAVEAASHAVEIALLKIERDAARARADDFERVSDRVADLQKHASAEARRATTLQRQLVKLEERHSEQLAAAAADAALLRDQLAAARSERDQAESSASDTERMDQVLAAKASAESSWLEAQDEAESMRGERDALAFKELTLLDELADYKARTQQLHDEVAELEGAERERRARRHGGSPQGGTYEEFMARVLPRLRLDPDDLELLLGWPSPRDAMQALMEINAGARPQNGKPVQVRQGWTEVAGINTGRKGSENLGRIYYRRVKASGHVRVCLHDKQDKKEQSRFLERLPDVD